MFRTTTAKLKKLMFVLFIVTLTFTMTLAVACTKKPNDNGDDNNGDNGTTQESTTTVSDYQSILNGDFEFKTDDKTSFPYLSSINWTRSYDKSVNSAPTSKSSGIIDTAEDKYKSLSADVKPTDANSEAINPHTPYYYGLLTNNYDKDDESKRSNPNVAGTKVLLLNNNVEGGTAQKVTSTSTITVPYEKYALISVWVKTEIEDVNKGAYISLNASLSSKTLNPIAFRNINTKGEWAKFSFYLKGSDLNNVTVKIVLGLGEGNGSLVKDYVKGFAYFDNVEFKEITKAEYDNSNEKQVYELGLNETLSAQSYLDNGEASEYDDATAKTKFTNVKYALDFTANLSSNSVAIDNSKINFLDSDKVNGDIKANNSIGYKPVGDLKADTAISEAVKNALSDKDNGNVLYFDFNKESSATAQSTEFTLEKESYAAYSFLTKVKVTNKSSYGLNVKYKELAYTQDGGSEESLDKTAVALFSDVKVYEVENGVYGDWSKYVVLFSNPTPDKIKFNLSFTFGIDQANEKIFPEFSLPSGYALVTDFNEIGSGTWTEDLYNNYLSSGTTIKNTLLGQYTSYSKENDTENKSDSYNLTADVGQLAVMPFKPSTSVNGFTFKGDNEKTVHGLINSKHIKSGKYGENAVEIENLDKLNDLKTLNNSTNEKNKYAQALTLYNKEATSSAYVTTKATLSANSYHLISVRLKAYGESVANVYLTGIEYDHSAKRYNVLSLKDDDGKVYELKASANKDTKNLTESEDGFITLSFYVATGNQDIDYRIEIWNGARDGSTLSKGTVYIDNVYVSDISSTEVDLNGRFALEGIIMDEYKALGNNYEFKSATYTRVPTTIKYTGSDDKEATKQEFYQPDVVLSQNEVTTFAYYTTVDVESERNETTGDDHDHDHDHEESDDEFKVNPTAWLQVVSIILAIILLIAVVAVIFRNNTKKVAKQKVKTQEYYHRDTREKALKKIAEDKKAINVEKDESDDKEYDYSAAENVEEGNETIEEDTLDLTNDSSEISEEPTETEETEEAPVEEGGETESIE